LLISGIFRVLITGIGRNPEGNAGDADDLSLNFPPRAYGRGTFFEGLSGQELALGAWRGPDGQQLERRHRRRRRRPQTVVVLYPRPWRRSSDRRGSPRCGLEWILRFGLGSFFSFWFGSCCLGGPRLDSIRCGRLGRSRGGWWASSSSSRGIVRDGFFLGALRGVSLSFLLGFGVRRGCCCCCE